MKIHKRHKIESEGRSKISESICNAAEQFELTPVEIIKILAGEISSYTMYALRFERHGNYEDEAGIEK